MLCPFLENNQVFFEIIIAVGSLLLGILAIIFGVKNIINDKQMDAQFGFYIHFLAFLERLKMLLNDYPDILQLFFDERTRKEIFKAQMPAERADIISPILSQLCNDIIEYFSKVDNIIPPYKKNSNEWKEWYKDLLIIINFLYTGKMMMNKIYLYTSKDKYDVYKREIESVGESFGRIEKSICEKLKLSGVQSTNLEKMNLPALKDKLDTQNYTIQSR
jgi:hypothetical protein